MKTTACLTLTILVAALAVAIGQDQKNPKPQGMSLRLELFVTDMDKSVDFYTKVLGFERLKGERNYVPVRSSSVVIGLGPAAGLSKEHYFNPELQSNRRGLAAR